MPSPTSSCAQNPSGRPVSCVAGPMTSSSGVPPHDPNSWWRSRRPRRRCGGVAGGHSRGVTAVPRPLARRRSLLTGAMLGVGAMAAADVVVFHLVLGWHHFYDRSTSAVALMSDGFLHAAELVVLVTGFYLFADLRRRDALAPGSAWAGLFLGLGAFQLFDGIVDHKLLRLHQVRYGVDLLPYDLAWIGGAVLLLVAGTALVLASRGEGRDPA